MMLWPTLALAQIRHRPARWALVALGLAIAMVIPVVTAATSAAVSARTVRRAIDSLPANQRTVTLTGQWWIYTSGHSQAEVDSAIVAALRHLTTRPFLRELTYREISENGSDFFLTATDQIQRALHLTSGRWPASCTPQRCEVVQLGPTIDESLAKVARAYGVTIVGTAARTDPTFMSGTFDTGATSVLVGATVDGLARLASLANFGKTYAWVSAIDADRVVRSGVPAFLREMQVQADHLTIGFAGLGLEQASPRLSEEDARARLSGGRFGLLGGAAAALLLSFVAVASVSLRRDQRVLADVLRMRGATAFAIASVPAVGFAAVALLGLVLAAVGGGVVAMLIVRGAGLRASATGHALESCWPGAVTLLVLGVAIALAFVLWPDQPAQSTWRVLDAISVGAVALAWLAISRGSVTADAVSSRSDPLLVALPTLVAVVAACVAARTWPLVTERLRWLSRRSIAASIAFLSASRRPLRAAVTTGFLGACFTSVVFSIGYRDTLLSGASDQAAFRVPLDAVLAPGRDTPNVLTAVPTSTITSDTGGARVHPVVAVSAVVRDTDGASQSVPVTGVDPAALEQIHRWSRVTGVSVSPQDIAARLSDTPAPGASITVPPGSAVMAFAVQGLQPGLAVQAWFGNDDGVRVAVDLRHEAGQLVGTVPTGILVDRLEAVSLSETDDYARRHLHVTGEGTTDVAVLTGRLVMGPPSFRSASGSTVTASWSPWSSTDTIVVPYQLTGRPVVVSGSAPAELPVLADPVTASHADHGVLALTVDGAAVAGRVVGVAPRFPTTGSTFLVADRSRLVSVVTRSNPGDAVPSSVWLTSDGTVQDQFARALTGPQFAGLSVTLRRDVERELRTDPVAIGSVGLLALVAALMAVIALVALALFVLGERRDEVAEWFAWEANGAEPEALRRVLFLRGLSSVVVATPVGVAAGLALTQLGANLVAVTAGGTVAVPPLQSALGWPLIALSVAALSIGGLAMAALPAATSFRETLALVPEVDLR